jgi:hypothetical protein
VQFEKTAGVATDSKSFAATVPGELAREKAALAHRPFRHTIRTSWRWVKPTAI